MSALLASRLAPRLARLVAVLALVTLAAACDGTGATDDDATVFSPDLVGRFQSRDRYVPLAEALALTGLDAELASGGPFTVLAPTRIAFRYVGDDFRPVLFADAERDVLRRVLRHHVVAGRLGPDDFADGAVLRDLDGGEIIVRRIGPVVTVNGVTLDVADPTEATNGVAYPLAEVLVDGIDAAERVRLSPTLSAFRDGLALRGVAAPFEALGAVTVLAPSNDGFTALGAPALRLLTADENADVYAQVLRSQIIPGDVDLASRVGGTVTTLAGDELAVTQDATRSLFVAGVRVLAAERTRDGRLYVTAQPVFSTLTVAQRIRIRPDLSLYLDRLRSAPDALARLNDRSAESTVFALSNTYYAGRTPALAAALAEAPQRPLERRVTQAHVAIGRYPLDALTDGLELPTVDGTVLRVGRTTVGASIQGFSVREAPLVQANGLLYVRDVAFLPDVDLLDTILLRAFVSFFRAVRADGLEAAYRTRVRTAFVVGDGFGVFFSDPNRAAILRQSATEDFLPSLSALALPAPFTTLDGVLRDLLPFDCRENPKVENCSPYGLENNLLFENPDMPGEFLVFVLANPLVYQGGTTLDGTAVYHPLRTPDSLPNAPFGTPPTVAARR